MSSHVLIVAAGIGSPPSITVVSVPATDWPLLTPDNYRVVARTSFWNKRDVALQIPLAELGTPAGAHAEGQAGAHAEGAVGVAGAVVGAARSAAVSRVVSYQHSEDRQRSLERDRAESDHDWPKGRA